MARLHECLSRLHERLAAWHVPRVRRHLDARDWWRARK